MSYDSTHMRKNIRISKKSNKKHEIWKPKFWRMVSESMSYDPNPYEKLYKNSKKEKYETSNLQT